MLLHLVSLESVDPVGDYTKIRNELAIFDPQIAEKEEWIILSKADLKDDGEVAEIKALFDKFNKRVFVISVNSQHNTKNLQDALAERLHKD